MVGRTLLHYRIVAKAGSGAMGEVYRAEDTKLERTVALKMLPEAVTADPERLARFRQEARVLAQLEHPNIVTIFSVEQVEDLHFLTMTWVEGETLEEALRRKGFLLEGLFSIALPLTQAVAAAHAKGIVHRDLKPANVMLGNDGSLKVLDFGLAHSAPIDGEVDSSARTLSRHGMLVGSLPYMSPEQVRGEAADVRSDVFALGAMLYEIATGVRPFQGDSAADLISAILRDSPPPVEQLRPELPRHLGRIIRRCLNKDPDRRFESARGLHYALDDLRTESATQHQELRSIAVLPFVDMSPNRDQGYFCEGIAEEILSALSALESLHVAARASSFQFREGAIDLRELGRRLNVQAILDGSVRKAGNRVRITAQLVNVADGYHLWSDRFDRELEDIFAIQDEIAASVVQALELTLSAEEEESLKHTAPDLAAYDYYLRGRSLVDRPTEKNILAAQKLFQQAIAIDPGYAPAWAGIAESHCWLFAWHGSCEDNLDEAERASSKAVELAPQSAEAFASRGYVRSLRGDCDAACADFARAIELNPRHFEAYYYWGRDRIAHGDFPRAVELLEQAAAVRPEDYQALLLAGEFYDPVEQAEARRSAIERGIERADRAFELNPEDARALYLTTGRLWELGRHDEARARAQRALELGPDDPTVLYNIACFHAVAGEVEPALTHLEKAMKLNFGLKVWIEKDTDLDSVRSDPRFQALLNRGS